MKNTFKIFFSDIKSLSRHFFAVLVVIAIMIIPALYAWVNIYANSDPYGNTGNISVAVASDDLGYEGQNMGESVLEGLKDNKSINWVFTGSTDKAIKGVESGKYYAAIVIGENFSRNMYDLKSALTDNESTVTYYKNAKTNAIAVKITDTAAETVQNNVKVQYLKVLFQTVFTKGQELGEDIDEEQAVNAVIAQLTDLSKSLRHYSDSVGRFVSDSSSISYVLSGIGSSTANASAALSGSQATLNSAQAAVSNAQTSIDQLANGLDGKLAELEADLDAVTDALNKLASSEVINGSIELHNQMVDNAKNAAAKLQTHLEALRAILPENSALSGTAYVANTLDALIERTKQMQNQLDLLYNDASFVEDAANITGACADTVSLMRSMITNQLKTGIDMMLTNLSSTLNMMSPLISSLGITLDDIAPVVESAGDTLSYVSSAMTRLQSLMNRVADACDQLLVKINEGTADERLQTLITVLNGNAEKYAEFLSSPVSVTEETIYPVASYGDAMTPFYSALAIWVGGVILTAILKVGRYISARLPVSGAGHVLGGVGNNELCLYGGDLFAGAGVRRYRQGDRDRHRRHAGRRLLRLLPDRDPAGYIQQDLSLLPLPVRHKRNARGDMRHVSMGLLDLSRRAYDIRRRRHTHRPCAEKAVYKAQPLRRARSGEIGGAVIWQRNSMSASAKTAPMCFTASCLCTPSRCTRAISAA